MQVTLPAPSHRHIAHRLAPIACGTGLAASAALVATNNPSAGRLHFPTCPFHQMTGLWCPACGLTRGTYQLLHGHVAAALSYNVFTPVVLVAVVVACVRMAARDMGRRTSRSARHRCGGR
jgi:hypothetical protein